MYKNTTRKERINDAFNYLRNQGIVMSQKEVAAQMKASRSNISSALAGSELVLTDKFLYRFNNAFGGLFNFTWLLTGEGEMLQEDVNKKKDIVNSEQIVTITPSNEGYVTNTYPIVPAALATQKNTDVYKVLSEGKVETSRLSSFSLFPDVELYYTVRLDAMSPNFISGDILALASFPEDGTIVAGTPYIIDTYSMGFIFRMIYDAGDRFEARALNTKSVYTPFTIMKTDIIRVYRVIGMARLV